jgi:hypothetical protein
MKRSNHPALRRRVFCCRRTAIAENGLFQPVNPPQVEKQQEQDKNTRNGL